MSTNHNHLIGTEETWQALDIIGHFSMLLLFMYWRHMQMRFTGQINPWTTNRNTAIYQSNLGEYFPLQFIVYHKPNVMCNSNCCGPMHVNTFMTTVPSGCMVRVLLKNKLWAIKDQTNSWQYFYEHHNIVQDSPGNTAIFCWCYCLNELCFAPNTVLTSLTTLYRSRKCWTIVPYLPFRLRNITT